MNLNRSFKEFKFRHRSNKNQIIYTSKKIKADEEILNLIDNFLSEKNSFIFESVEKGKIKGRYTIFGKNPDKIWEFRNKDSYFSNLVTTEFQTIEYSNLSGNWIELLLGIKVETFKNVYLGLSLRLNKLLSDKKPDNFGNLFIPGFNKVTDENTFGSGFNYTLTYSIPLKKRK